MAGVRLVVDLDLDELAIVLDCMSAAQWLPKGAPVPPPQLIVPLLHRLLLLMLEAQKGEPEFPTIPGDLG
jgi:hypothetical protein